MENTAVKTWRKPNSHKPMPGRTSLVVNPLKIFDQLSFIGTTTYACYVLETSDGYVMFDCLACGDRYVHIIEEGFCDLGLDIHNLKAILVTHGHGDHYGYANVLRERYGCKIYMSEVDYKYIRAADDPNDFFPDGPLKWEVDGYLEDGVPFRLGDTEIQIVATPGHTYGSMSFIIPVTDEGVPHMISLWGGTGVPGDPKKSQAYLESCDKFAAICDRFGVDGEITNHPYIDMSVQRIELMRNIIDGVPNLFVLGREGYKYYEKMIRDNCLKKIEEVKRDPEKAKPPLFPGMPGYKPPKQ